MGCGQNVIDVVNPERLVAGRNKWYDNESGWHVPDTPGNGEGKLLVVDGDKLKFESNPRDFQAITEQIDSLLYGLF